MAQFIHAGKLIINLDNVTHVKVVAEHRVDVFVVGNDHSVVSLQGEEATQFLKAIRDPDA